MSWGRVRYASKLISAGQEIEVKILAIQREKRWINPGLKQLLPNAWETVGNKYAVGEKVKGIIVNLVDYGAFVELEPGLEGLVHVTELSWSKSIVKPADLLKVDQEVEVVVLDINREQQKISLSLRQLEANPFGKAMDKYPPGTRVKGKIRNILSCGAFIELEEGIDGMIHVSNISWTREINHPSQVLNKGDEVEAVVLEIDKTNQRIALGIKQLTADPWSNIGQYYKIGDIVTGNVYKLSNLWALVELKPGCTGYLHISETQESQVRNIEDALALGQDIRVRIIANDKEQRRIAVSTKAAATISD
jgi:small subunit ribosomal protein S1